MRRIASYCIVQYGLKHFEIGEYTKKFRLEISRMPVLMENQENQPNVEEPLPNPNRFWNRRSRTFAFYLSSLLILLLAISSFNFTKSNFYRTHYRKYFLSPNPPLYQSLMGLFSPPQKSKPTALKEPVSVSPNCVLWMAPFLSGGGYSSEAWSYVLALHQQMKNHGFKLAIEQHGDQVSLDFWEGLPQDVKNLAVELYQTQCRMHESIVICHSEPGAWNPPLFETLPCPPSAYQNFKSVIGRTMFETDRVNPEHVKRCNRMDYIWVPTEFHVSTFVESGVDASKVVKLPQPIDVEFFDPLKHKPLDLESMGKLILGGKNPEAKSDKKFVFLSIFKWEYRKGWDVLLRAYLNEFSGDERVALFLLTNPYHSDRDFGNKILDFVEKSDMEEPGSGWAPIYVIDKHVAQVDLPRVYKAADAFVLPSRGEGWGRPIVEAMAMSLPVITTNWSGPTEYLTDGNSYPVPVHTMSEVTEGPFRGHLWAEPSVSELQVLMRRVVVNGDEAKAKGNEAREDMKRKFAPEMVADILARHIVNILNKTS